MTRSHEATLERSRKVPSLPVLRGAPPGASARRPRSSTPRPAAAGRGSAAMFAVVKADITQPVAEDGELERVAQEPEHPRNDRQERDDPDALEALRHAGFEPGLRHLQPQRGALDGRRRRAWTTPRRCRRAPAARRGASSGPSSVHEGQPLHGAAPDVDRVRVELEARAVRSRRPRSPGRSRSRDRRSTLNGDGVRELDLAVVDPHVERPDVETTFCFGPPARAAPCRRASPTRGGGRDGLRRLREEHVDLALLKVDRLARPAKVLSASRSMSAVLLKSCCALDVVDGAGSARPWGSPSPVWTGLR
jgi:hypothetical protein